MGFLPYQHLDVCIRTCMLATQRPPWSGFCEQEMTMWKRLAKWLAISEILHIHLANLNMKCWSLDYMTIDGKIWHEFVCFVQLIDCLNWRVSNKIDNILAVCSFTVYNWDGLNLTLNWVMICYGFSILLTQTAQSMFHMVSTDLDVFCVPETYYAQGDFWPYSWVTIDWLLWIL